MDKYVLGVDLGTDSCRAVLVNTANGEECDIETSLYSRWDKGLYSDPKLSQYRLHPLDYLEALKRVIQSLTDRCGDEIAENIVALSVATTGSTPCAVTQAGVPLAMLDEFSETPDAMFILWKDHTAVREAEEITAKAKKWGDVDYTKYVGGVYSAEWFFAKILHVLRHNRRVARAAYSWVELCDWITAVLTGVTKADDIIRSRCAAGHKAMWNMEFGGLPPNDFLKAVDPLLDGYGNLFQETLTSDKCAGVITKEWARDLGLTRDVKIGVGAFNAHMGAVGANIKTNSLVKIMGTSTCDIMVAEYDEIGDNLVEGICGQVDGSVMPGMIGLEAGQSAFGDVYAWYRDLLMWPLYKMVPESKLSSEEKRSIKSRLLSELEREAESIEPKESAPLALDWHNGRRTPFANQNLKGAFSGLTLGSDAPQLCRSLIEATAYGAKAIVERFEGSGVEVGEIIAIGGVARKSRLTMQIGANVLGMPVKVCKSEQCVALGAAIFASVAGGVHPDVMSAQRRMASPFESIYFPDEYQTEIYDKIYDKYLQFGEYVEKSILEEAGKKE